MLGPRVPLCSGTAKGRGLALVRIGGDGAQGEGGRNMIGDGELSRGCIRGALYGLNRFGFWPDILIVQRNGDLDVSLCCFLLLLLNWCGVNYSFITFVNSVCRLFFRSSISWSSSKAMNDHLALVRIYLALSHALPVIGGDMFCSKMVIVAGV